MGTVQGLAKAVEGELAGVMPDMYRDPPKRLAIMVPCWVETRSSNKRDLGAKLPIETERVESRYAWIERFLSAETIDDMAAMGGRRGGVVGALPEKGRHVV